MAASSSNGMSNDGFMVVAAFLALAALAAPTLEGSEEKAPRGVISTVVGCFISAINDAEISTSWS